jgi:hypothetical protein
MSLVVPPDAVAIPVEDLLAALTSLELTLLDHWPTPQSAPPDIREAVIRVQRAKAAALTVRATEQLWQMGAERPPGVFAISVERHHQIVDRGFSLQHDRRHASGELARAAVFYLNTYLSDNPELPEHPEPTEDEWPFERPEDYPDDRILAVAGAFCAAEFDRLAPR